MNTCRRTFRNVEKDATGLLNKADAKNRESENPEEISLSSGRTPPRLCSNTGVALRNREPAERGEDGPSVCEYGRNDKTPKGLPHGSCVKERAARVGGRRCGSPGEALFITFLCSSVVTCCIEMRYCNNTRTAEAEAMSRRQDRFPFFQSYQSFLPHWDRLPNCTPFPNRSPSRQREKPLVFEGVVEHGRLEGAGISRLFVTGFRSA